LITVRAYLYRIVYHIVLIHYNLLTNFDDFEYSDGAAQQQWFYEYVIDY